MQRGCRCKAEARPGGANGATPGVWKVSWGFLGVSRPSIGRGLDQHRVRILQWVEKAEGAGESPGGIVRVCADDVGYK